jgi:hypothetical protein
MTPNTKNATAPAINTNIILLLACVVFTESSSTPGTVDTTKPAAQRLTHRGYIYWPAFLTPDIAAVSGVAEAGADDGSGKLSVQKHVRLRLMHGCL